ncbi:MAG: flagellar biosynthetic protein FliR [SAR86 cluster bacterium]|uniref:Flagellar biosynthetic protein FliR n=1 Tax=SAR86 cluster bacterium TaxID=2030880 RepID=A0A2A5B537_9GAMM|nr:MAG: flagellar biosynthetic protein FliR [SAR86 cluster bacterium]
MEIQLDEITGWVGDFFWPFLRLGALFVAAPIFGARTVPVRIRIILAFVITLLIQPTLPFLETINPLSPEGILVILQQLSIGLLMGMTLQIMLGALVMAGMIVATTMGLGFASTVDPQNGVQVTMLGQFYLIIATLFFLSLDGHLLLLKTLADSFTALPINSELISVQAFWNVSTYVSEMFLMAVLIALPTMVGVLLVNLGLGVVTRAAPSLNIFAVGFPVTMLAGFILMFLSLPLMSTLLMNLFTSSFDFMRTMVN